MRSLLTFCLLVVLFSGCQKGESIAEAAAKADMKPSEFIGMLEIGPAGIALTRVQFEDFIKDWERRRDTGDWMKEVAAGTHTESMEKRYDGFPESYPDWRIRELKKAIDKMDIVLAYIDENPEAVNR